jgi:hypothetical protein
MTTSMKLISKLDTVLDDYNKNIYCYGKIP